MVNFSNLRKLDVTSEAVARWTMVDVEGQPFLNVRPAGEVNKPFFSEMVRRTKQAAKAVNAGSIGSELLAQNRDADRMLYAKHVIVGWGNVVDAEGKAVQFSEANCAEFLQQLPDWLFDRLRQFCTSIENFVDTPQIDTQAASGNS